MLKTYVPIEETYRNATRPTIYESLKSMLVFYGLDSTAEIYFNGENEIAKLVGSNSGDAPRTDVFTDGLFRNKLYIVAETNPTAFNSGYGNARRERTELPVWENKELGLALIPVFEGRKINVEINAHFSERNTAQAFVNNIRFLQAQQVADMEFSAYVHYPVNNAILAFMEHVYDLLVKNGAVTETCPEWFKRYALTPFTTVTNVAGNNNTLVVPKRIDNHGIQLEDPEIKLAQKGQLIGKYEVSLSYFFYYQECIGWELEYPLNVYQDEIDAKWIPKINEQFRRGFTRNSNPELALGNMLTPYARSEHTPYFLCLPKHDPFRKEYLSWINPCIQARLTVANVPNQVLLDINDIPGIEWDPVVYQYILRRHAKAFMHHSTPFLFSVYSNTLAVNVTQLTMDPMGVISMLRHPTMANTHRMFLDFDLAITDYTQEFWDDIYHHPEDWPILPGLFPWYDWTDWEKKFPQCIIDIGIGTGGSGGWGNGPAGGSGNENGEGWGSLQRWNHLMMWMGLIAHKEGK